MLSGLPLKKFVDPFTGVSIMTKVANMQQKHTFIKLMCNLTVYVCQQLYEVLGNREVTETILAIAFLELQCRTHTSLN